MKGHIKKRGNSWSIVIYLGRNTEGKRQYKWHTVSGTKKDAEREMHQLLVALGDGKYIEPNKLTVREYLYKWLELVKPKLTLKTYSRYEEICEKHLIPALGHHRLMKLNGLHIEDYYAQARESGRVDGKGGLSEQTLLHHHRVLKEALQKAVRLKQRSGNPADDVDTPKPRKNQVKVLDEEQTIKLLEAAGTQLYTPILLTVTTGLRLGELLGLRWKDVKGGKISVRQTLQRIKGHGLVLKDYPKSKSSARNVSLPSLALEVLKAHKVEQSKIRLLLGPDYRKDLDLVFPAWDGSPWSPDSVSHMFKRLAKKLGYHDITFHGLRHTHASHLLKQNVHMKIASERLGHSSINITMDLYSHLLDGMDDEAANKIDQALRAAMKKRD